MRRLAAILYDTLLLIAVLLVATALLLPFTHGDAIEAHNPYYRTYLLFVCFFYFAWPWTHGGQTLGMRAWRLRVQHPAGGAISIWQALLRFAAGAVSWIILGLGFFWSLIDRKRRAWHDIFSESVLVTLPRQKR